MKKYLAIILSIAILAVAIPFGVFAGAGTATDTWTGGNTKPTTQDADGNYIINTPEELAWVALYGGTETAGNTYKVADNKVFNMNGFEGITPNSTAEAIKTATATGTEWYNAGVCDWNASNTYTSFQGTFDGNGVIIYNLNARGANHAGLFPQIRNVNNSINNISVKASAFKGVNLGGIVGNAFGNGYDISINGCAVENCYFYSTAAQTERLSAGAFVGFSEHLGITINNCYAANNEFDATSLKIYGGFIGDVTKWGHAVSFTNSVSIGSSPFPAVKAGAALTSETKLGAATWSNVYSDTDTSDSAFDSAKSGISVLTIDNMTGANAAANMSLDWNTWFANVQGAPVLRAFHSFSVVDLQNGKHAEYCVDCNGNLTGLEQNHTPVLNDTADALVCDCGYSEAVVGRPNVKGSDTWTGEKTAPTTLDTTDETGNTYIINTAEELAWIALQGGDATAGKTYKVNPDIKAFYISTGYNNSTPDELKASLLTVANKWVTNPSNTTGPAFQGHFDGNGVTIYGLPAHNTSGNAGLFPIVKGDVSFKNVKVTDSLISGSLPAGAIVGGPYNIGSNSIVNISFEKCAVVNNYIENNHGSRPNAQWGAMGGLAGSVDIPTNSLSIDSCVVVNNTINNPNTNTIEKGFIGHWGANADDTVTTHTVTNSITDLSPYTNSYHVAKKNPFYNVYTTYTTAPETGSYTAEMVSVLSADEMQGAGAVATMNLGSNWFDTAGYPELHVFHDMLTVPVGTDSHQSSCQIYIDGDQCDTCGVAVAHTYDKEAADGKCTVCNADCAHPTTDTRQEDVNGPTCGAAGSYTLVTFCTECNKVTDRAENQVGDAATGNHTFDNTAENPTGLCTVCSTPCGHTDTRWVSNNDGTCTTADTGKTVCNICGVATFTGSNPSFSGTAHTFDKTAADGKCTVCSADCAHPTTDTRNEDVNGPTCGAAGSYTLVTFCTECNKVTKTEPNQVGDAATGNHTYDKDVADGICTVCSAECAHPTTDTRKDDIHGPSCVDAGSYTLVTFCTECNKVTKTEPNQVGDAATGHTFHDVEAEEGTCSWEGNIAYKDCSICGEIFAADEIDKFSKNYLDYEDILTDFAPNSHRWIEVKAADATTEKEGNIAYKYCELCARLVVGDKELELEEKVYTEKLNEILEEKFEELEKQNLSGEEFDKAWQAIYKSEFQKAIVAAAKAEGVTLTIDKVVVEEPKPEDTKTEDNKTEDNKTETKPEVDNNKTSPDTSDNLVTVVLMATLIGAAFVIVRKARKA